MATKLDPNKKNPKTGKRWSDATFPVRDLDAAVTVRDKLDQLFNIRNDLELSTNILGLIEELQSIHDSCEDDLVVRSDVFLAVRTVVAETLDLHIAKRTDKLMHMGIDAFDYRNRLASFYVNPWEPDK